MKGTIFVVLIWKYESPVLFKLDNAFWNMLFLMLTAGWIRSEAWLHHFWKHKWKIVCSAAQDPSFLQDRTFGSFKLSNTLAHQTNIGSTNFLILWFRTLPCRVNQWTIHLSNFLFLFTIQLNQTARVWTDFCINFLLDKFRKVVR